MWFVGNIDMCSICSIRKISNQKEEGKEREKQKMEEISNRNKIKWIDIKMKYIIIIYITSIAALFYYFQIEWVLLVFL